MPKTGEHVEKAGAYRCNKCRKLSHHFPVCTTFPPCPHCKEGTTYTYEPTE